LKAAKLAKSSSLLSVSPVPCFPASWSTVAIRALPSRCRCRCAFAVYGHRAAPVPIGIARDPLARHRNEPP
jgi:hypothetical protein